MGYPDVSNLVGRTEKNYKMKIIRIIARLNIGGPSIHISNLCNLQNMGHQTVLIYGATSPGEGDMAYLLKDKNVKTHYVPELGREISFLKDIKTFWKIYKIIRKEKPDIVHTHTAKAGMLGRAAAKFAGVKKIYHTFHGHVFHGYFSPLKTKFFIVLEYLLSLVSTKIITLNTQQQNEIASFTGINKDKFVVVPLGFDLAKLQALPNIVDKNKPLRIGIVGRLTAIKNHTLFVEVLKNIYKNKFSFTAEIIGDGELRKEIEKQIEHYGLQTHVTFRGWVTNTAEIYKNLDYLFLTSLNEGTPVAVIEAMAARKVVITTPAGGVVDIANHGQNGFVSKDFTAESFTDAFLQSIEISPEEVEKILGNAQKTAEQFSLATLLANINNLYTTGK